ncbi:MAG: hypothetical protein LBR95_07255, partial [Azoarcus sp.]|nr:hypothetical protein [Azoarcus sp.]
MRALTLTVFSVAIFCPASSGAAEVVAGVGWLDGFTFSGDLMYFQRHRDRYRIDEDRYATNLHHRTVQARFDVDSVFIADAFGVDL